MKNKAILALLIAGTVGFTACTRKIDEKTMGEITQFGTDWTSLGEKANSWSQELNTTAANAKEFAQKQSETATKYATSKDQVMKTKSAEMANVAAENASKLDAMQNEWNTFKATWDETTKQFGEWKDKVSKGEVPAEDAIKGLADFKTKMTDAQTKVDTWSAAYAETKTSCEQNMAAADEMAKSMESTSKK